MKAQVWVESRRLSIKKLVVLSVAVVALLNQSAFAGDIQDAGVYIAPSLGYLTHSSNRQSADDDFSASIALGYQWASPWAMELAYSKSSPESTIFSGDIDSEQTRLDALYHFSSSEKLQPYFVFGAGESELSNSLGSASETMLNAGLGLKYAFNDIASLRTDIRTLFGTETDATEAAFNFGLQILLGKSSSSKPAVVAQAKDSDSDGVLDSKDKCPSSMSGTKVDANGCELPKDSDGDGVVDALDKCPDSAKGSKVDSKGCYRVLTEDLSIALNIQFANNSDVVVSENLDQVEELAEFMNQYPQTKVEIEGHTDDRGAAAYNKTLSQKRAVAVGRILVETYGIDSQRVKAVGYGEENPIASNASAEGRAKNRRVQAVVRATIEKIVK